MFLVGRNMDNIAWPDFLRWTTPLLHPTDACRHNERLTQRMSMPIRSRTRRKGDTSATHA